MVPDQKALESAAFHGFVWIADFIRKDENFEFIFSDYVVMLYELSLNDSSTRVQQLARKLSRSAFKRALPRLDEIFPPTGTGKWDFISVIPVIHHFGIDIGPYLKFYQRHFPKGFIDSGEISFAKARKTLNYDILGDYLLDIWFVEWTSASFENTPFTLPPNHYDDYLKRVESTPFIHQSSDDQIDYSDQNYFLTHVVLVMSNYGMSNYAGESLGDSALGTRLLDYFIRDYDAIRFQVRDLDLIAEVLQCFRLLGAGERVFVNEGLSYLLREQHADGSWGTKEDAEGDPYDVFHPTWAAITAINGYISAPGQKPRAIKLAP